MGFSKRKREILLTRPRPAPPRPASPRPVPLPPRCAEYLQTSRWRISYLEHTPIRIAKSKERENREEEKKKQNRQNIQGGLANTLAAPADPLPNDPAHATIPYLGEHVTIPLPLLGAFQLANVATAVKALEAVAPPAPGPGRRLDFRPRDRPLARAPRMARHSSDRAYPDVLAQFVNALRTPEQPVRWIVGFTRGKDIGAIFTRLLRPGDTLCAVSFSQPQGMPWIRSTPVDDIRRVVDTVAPGTLTRGFEDGVVAALDALRDEADHGAMTVLCGSLYLVADLYRGLGVQL
ncbi:hypothetical protein BDK51DRAFT_38091 [Blyttiomyces helicus]|uniref:Uncharacterized protein n=1 Tax=Blyttiomyces helicus TaxID=388810 RepID=A0A4P9VZ00_9FUNG|nr:hypothetical protein BDK51DRAFT_38091 [Blyttiomyces helicus]|eukprot:RKO85029.1 hypothetical protein BDK51DRAFT_38091 [Blyttiomyces helicus]